MKAVTQKLKSRCGISLAIALVFFLLCAMVGTVVLTAASASAGNTARERQLYRETQALISAAQLLSDDIQGMTYTGSFYKTEIVTTTASGSGEDAKTTVTREYKLKTVRTFEESPILTTNPMLDNSKLFGPKDDTDSLNLTGHFKANLLKQLDKLIDLGKLTDETTTPSASQDPVALTFEYTGETYDISKVTGNITVGEDYSLTVELICGKSQNRMTLTFPAKSSTKTVVTGPKTTQSENPTEKTTETTYTTTITWEQALMQEGGKADGQTTTS